jgi:putative ABC transport system ATP-binding protein
MLESHDIRYTHDGEHAMKFPDFELKQGEHMLIIGASGCGKTTLLHLLAGLLIPKSGYIKIGDTKINELRKTQLDHFRGQHIGMIFQRPHFVFSLDVLENVMLSAQLAGKNRSEKDARILLDKLGIGHKCHKRITSLSEGEKQRLSIARALFNEPLLLLADEPTSALDDSNAQKVIELLLQLKSDFNTTVVVVTHDGRVSDYFEKKIHLDK